MRLRHEFLCLASAAFQGLNELHAGGRARHARASPAGPSDCRPVPTPEEVRSPRPPAAWYTHAKKRATLRSRQPRHSPDDPGHYASISSSIGRMTDPLILRPIRGRMGCLKAANRQWNHQPSDQTARHQTGGQAERAGPESKRNTQQSCTRTPEPAQPTTTPVCFEDQRAGTAAGAIASPLQRSSRSKAVSHHARQDRQRVVMQEVTHGLNVRVASRSHQEQKDHRANARTPRTAGRATSRAVRDASTRPGLCGRESRTQPEAAGEAPGRRFCRQVGSQVTISALELSIHELLSFASE